MLDDDLKRIKELMMVEDETDAPADDGSSSGPSSGGEGYPSVTKWESGLTRGNANPVGNTKWESGLTRGSANQIGVTKWSSGTKRGKGNTLL